MVKMNIFNAARHEVPSISIKQPLCGCFIRHTSRSDLSKRSALVIIIILHPSYQLVKAEDNNVQDMQYNPQLGTLYNTTQTQTQSTDTS